MEKRYKFDTDDFNKIHSQTKRDRRGIIISILMLIICFVLKKSIGG